MCVEYDPRLKASQSIDYTYIADNATNRSKHEFDEMTAIHADICNGKPEFLLSADLKEQYHNWLRYKNGFNN